MISGCRCYERRGGGGAEPFTPERENPLRIRNPVARWLRTEKVKPALSRLIAENRHMAAVRAVHAATAFIENAYANVGTDLHVNGELALLKRLQPAALRTVLDVGANEGEWLAEALRLWPEAFVHAFEVAPATADALARRIGGQGLSDRFKLHRLGLSDAIGSAPMYYYPERPQLTCDTPRHDGGVLFEAQLTTLDAFAAEEPLDVIDFLKIDVEGSEHRVLDGARGHIDQDKVKIIQFEYGAFAIDTRVLLYDMYNRLKNKYWIGKIFPNAVEFCDYDLYAEDFKFANYLCVHRDEAGLKELAAGTAR